MQISQNLDQFTTQECIRTEHEKIWVLRPNSWFGYKNKESFKKWLYCKIAELEKAAYKCDNETIRKKANFILDYLKKRYRKNIYKG